MKDFLLSLLVACSIGTTTNVVAQKSNTPQFVTTVEGIKEYSLANGLQVLLLPDQSQNNMIVNIIYHVGSKHEGYGEKGMAHLLEHMLFKSTKNLGDIKKMLSDKGGQANGTTWYDRTNYFEIFPYSEENLRWSIEMEADRMINATILQSDLENEFSVVRNEFEIGENSPRSVLMSRVISAGYLWHNYGKSTIGSKEDIERVKAPQLRRFYEKYYQPDNAVLVIGGKFEEGKALKYIEQYFGKIPKPTRVFDDILTVEPAQDGEKYVELKRAGDSQSVGVMYHTAAYGDKDFATLALLDQILVANPSGYLYKALVDTHKVAAVWSFQPSVRDAGFMYFGAEVSKDKNLQQTRDDVKKELDKIAEINYTAEDLKRAQAALIKQIDNIKNNTINYSIFLTDVVSSGDYRLAFIHRDNIEKVTLEDIRSVAKKYFRENNRTLGIFIPSKDEIRVKPNELSNDNIIKLVGNYEGRTREKEAKPFEATIDNLKKNYTSFTLANGLKVGIIDKEINGEKVMISLSLPVANEQDLIGKKSVGNLTGLLMLSGTKNMTKEQIKDRLDELKSTVRFSFNEQTLHIIISTYRYSLKETMDVIRQLIFEPTFPQAELTKLINEQVTLLEANLNDPRSFAFNEINKLTSNYSTNSIFYVQSIEESIESIKNVKQHELIQFHNSILGTQHGVSSVIGISDKALIEKLFNETFGKWNSKATFVKAYPSTTSTTKLDKLYNLIDKENATAVGRINFKMTQYDPEYPAFLIANEIMGSGGFITARIPVRLREKDGISYGAGSSLSISQDRKNNAAKWSYYAFFNPTKRNEVEKAVKEEITLALSQGFTQQELTDNINSWKVSRKTSLGNDVTLLNISTSHLLNDMSFDHYNTLESKIEKLTLKEVNDVFKKYIDLQKLTSIYAGTFEDK